MYRLVFSLVFLLAVACGSDSEPVVPTDCLGRPLTTPPPTGRVRLAWQAPTTQTDGSPFDDLAGYRINYGIAPDQLRCQVEIRDPKATSGEVTGLTPGTWHFAVVSFDSGFVESAPSNVVTKQID